LYLQSPAGEHSQLQRAELLFQMAARRIFQSFSFHFVRAFKKKWTRLHFVMRFLSFVIYNERKKTNLQEFILISGGYRKLVFVSKTKKLGENGYQFLVSFVTYLLWRRLWQPVTLSTAHDISQFSAV